LLPERAREKLTSRFLLRRPPIAASVLVHAECIVRALLVAPKEVVAAAAVCRRAILEVFRAPWRGGRCQEGFPVWRRRRRRAGWWWRRQRKLLTSPVWPTSLTAADGDACGIVRTLAVAAHLLGAAAATERGALLEVRRTVIRAHYHKRMKAALVRWRWRRMGRRRRCRQLQDLARSSRPQLLARPGGQARSVEIAFAIAGVHLWALAAMRVQAVAVVCGAIGTPLHDERRGRWCHVFHLKLLTGPCPLVGESLTRYQHFRPPGLARALWHTFGVERPLLVASKPLVALTALRLSAVGMIFRAVLVQCGSRSGHA